MPIVDPKGWSVKLAAARERQQRAEERAAIRAERNRMANAKTVAVHEAESGVNPTPAPQVDADSMTAKALREALVEGGYTVPLATTKQRLVELYAEMTAK